MKYIYSRGFTFIELLLVIALLFVLSAITVTFYSRFLLQSSVQNTVDQLTGELRKAQVYSMMGRQNGGTWGVAYTSGNIILFLGNSFSERNTAFDETFTVNPNIQIGSFSEIEFMHMTGTPSATPMITISSGSNTKTISINSQGVANKN